MALKPALDDRGTLIIAAAAALCALAYGVPRLRAGAPEEPAIGTTD